MPRRECFAEATLAIDEESHKNITLTGCRGQVVRSIDGENVDSVVHTSSDYYHGALGLLEQAKDNLGNLTRFVYDDFGRKIRSVDPDSEPGTYNRPLMAC